MIVKRPRIRVEAEPAHGQKMKDVHPPVSAVGRIAAGQEGRYHDPFGRHLENKLFEKAPIQAAPTVTVQEPHVIEERVFEEFLFSDQVESPTLLGRKRPADRQLSLDDRPSNPAGGFALHKTFSAVGHLHQEIRHDVARAGVFLSFAR